MKRFYLYFKQKVEEGTSSRPYRVLLFWGLGISSTLWFLIRVLPKPSRASYPCMQTAAPLMSAFVLYLLSFTGAWLSFRKLGENVRKHRWGWGIACLFSAVFCSFLLLVENSTEVLARTVLPIPTVKMVQAPLTPVGDAKGIHPGRVAWAYVPGAATWIKGEGHWYEERWNSQPAADMLVRTALLSLTGKPDEKQAWEALFTSFNKDRDKDKGYSAGQRIAIKINMNNTAGYVDNEELNASPHVTLALLQSLVQEGGVPQEMITVFDASRFMTDALFHKCHDLLPRIIYMDHEGMHGRTKATYVADAIPYSEDNGKLARGLATCVIDADYVMNMALLKGHVGQGVTLCGKNWYGVTDIDPDWRKNFHNNFDQSRDGKPKYLTFVDYMGHKDLGGKTMLYLIDGLYGSKDVNGAPSGTWQMPPFSGNWPCSLFASQDPVAIDAVAVDFLATEFPRMADVDYCDMYLVEAAMADKPLSGTFYDPERDGTGLQSLGVMEHWNNPVDKQYSRNLGKDAGIELVYTVRNLK